MKNSILISSLISATLFACSDNSIKQTAEGNLNNIWSEENQNKYLSECINGSKSQIGKELSTILCQCTMGKLISSNKSIPEVNSMTDEELRVIAQECLKEKANEQKNRQ